MFQIEIYLNGKQTSALLVEIWKEGVTQLPHEHTEPHQLKDPNLASHFGQFI